MNKPIRLGYINLSFHQASAAVVQAILEREGHEVVVSAFAHEEMFRRFGEGEVDFLVSAWLPDSHGAYLKPLADATRKLGVLYQPYCIWGVPDYVPESAVSEIADLLKPDVLARMDRTLQGINPGAGISRFSQSMVQAYGLSTAGYHFQPGSEAACFDGYEQAVSEERWLVVPLWHPQYLHHRYRIRALHEPLGLLGGADDATLLIRRDAEPRLNPQTLAILADLHLGNAVVTRIDHAIRKEGVNPMTAAREWLAEQLRQPSGIRLDKGLV
ncbi:glycine betaine ABC transporter substrate-binding protein [Pseudomonas gingeri]|uniref:glycine betaine ABC transporter substrate-binding protein n=1 Tax=Pseudomonas gingeri TaxID=117681 RepID=UPI0015A2EEEF|nr:glycine betaine ABC transporter substrate-binding protein [Pseudomonas gingeri]NWD73515.1 glycine betaine ABC transporter substrate-binding protein [Pseudomonas gingeri]